MRPRPRLLMDIRREGRIDVFTPRQERVNLGQVVSKNKPGGYRFQPVLVAVLVIGALSANLSVFAPVGGGARALTVEQEREKYEEQLKELEGQIEEYQKTINQYQKQGATLQEEIDRLNGKIKAINGQINQINATLANLTGQINKTTSKIEEVQRKVDRSKDAIATIIRRLDKDDQRGMLQILFENPTLSDFFISVNDLLLVQENLKNSVDELTELKSGLITQKELLALEKSDVEILRLYQERQRQDVASTKAQKDTVLSETKGQEAAYQQLLTRTEQSAAEIRVKIFRLLGGGQMTFEEAYNFAKYAEQRTGVRAALIMAVLDRESALGRNVGQCTYQTAMHPTRDIPHFLEITKELGLDPEDVKVSCPIVADGAYGGAMGPAQFIPSTWVGYRARVEAITGSKPASPWRNLDAFVAAALYLKDAGAATNELAAAARYYCGGNWQRPVCTGVYGAGVVGRAAEIQRDINILER